MNTAATSNDEIVEMLKRSSSAMAEANNELEETIALETAAVEITRNAESVGTAFRTISMRIRGKSLPPYLETDMQRKADDNYISQRVWGHQRLRKGL